MNDLIKIGELVKEGETIAIILRSRLRGTYHVYDVEIGYVCAEPEDETAFASYERSMKRKGFQVVITVKPEEQSQITTLRIPKTAWELLRETLEMDTKSKAFDPSLRKQITAALNSVIEAPEQ